jgi:hypothetical protein
LALKGKPMQKADVYPSRFLKADDIGNKEVAVEMESIEMVSLADGEPEKPVLHFKNKDKGMVINPTNWDRIAYTYGDESDDWMGNTIVIYTELVSFKGKTGPALRVKAPKANTGKKPVRRETENPAEGFEDDPIPF